MTTVARCKLRWSAALILVQGILMEGVVFLGLIVLLVMDLPQGTITDRAQIFALPYLQQNLYLMMAMSGIFAALRIIGAAAMLRGRVWGVALSAIMCVVTLVLMIFMLPAGIADGILSGAALIVLLQAWFGDRAIGDIEARTPTAAQSQNVKQLRVVVEADDFDTALAFYRDTLGMTQREAYEGEGDARVVILDGGAATLELANPAQVRLIDAVETDGARSPHIRLAFEVDDTDAATTRLVTAGAELIATPRETPWRSLNSRLGTPAGLQVTLFQELDR